MKKLLITVLCLLLICGLSACGGGDKQPNRDNPVQTADKQDNKQENEAPEKGRVLVVYFSMPETSNPDNMTTEEDNSVVVIDGQGCVKEYLDCLVKDYRRIMLCYGGGSIKRSGVYEGICGLPTNFKELGLAANLNLREIADSCAISAGSFRQLTHNEILQIFQECC